jgi:hypothetical protein
MTREVRERDGKRWAIGSGDDVAWIADSVDLSAEKVSLVPPGFAAYCRLDLPERTLGSQIRHDQALVVRLSREPAAQQWWLGYLEYGIGIDLPFSDAARTKLFGWDYVLVQAGAEQALNWRASESPIAWKGALPDVMFPADRSWVLVTDWDERWSGIGGTGRLVQSLLDDPELGPRTERVTHPLCRPLRQ